MKRLSSALCLLLFAHPVWSASLYRAVVHVVSSDGKYQKHPLKETGEGVSRMECDLRRENWLKEFGPALDSAQKTLKESGSKPASYRVECERVAQ